MILHFKAQNYKNSVLLHVNNPMDINLHFIHFRSQFYQNPALCIFSLLAFKSSTNWTLPWVEHKYPLHVCHIM